MLDLIKGFFCSFSSALTLITFSPPLPSCLLHYEKHTDTDLLPIKLMNMLDTIKHSLAVQSTCFNMTPSEGDFFFAHSKVFNPSAKLVSTWCKPVKLQTRQGAIVLKAVEKTYLNLIIDHNV